MSSVLFIRHFAKKILIQSVVMGVAIYCCSCSVQISGPAARSATNAIPNLDTFSVTNSAYTNSTSYALSFFVSGSYTDFCILENNTTVTNCVWVTGTIPSSYTVTSTENAKVLSLWVRNVYGTSARMDSNSVTLDTTVPTRPTALSLSNPATSPSLDTTPTISISSIEAYASVQLFSDSGCTTQVGTLADAGSGGGTVLVTSDPLSVGSKNFCAKQTDRAGNVSAVTLVTLPYQLNASPASLSITSHSPPHDFGSVSVSSTVTEVFTLENSGGSAVTNMVYSGLSGVFVKTGAGSCATTLAVGGTCTIEIEYTPTAAVSSTQTLNIAYDDAVGQSGDYDFDLTGTGAAVGPAPFVSIWNTQGTTTITLPLVMGYSYNFTVDWGDGSTSTVTAYNDPDITHNYVSSGIYTLTLSGLAEAWSFAGLGDRLKIIEVTDFGDLGWINLYGAFRGCSNLISFSGGVTDGVTDMGLMFYSAAALTTLDLSNFNTQNVHNMSYMFQGTFSLTTLDLSSFNTSNVVYMMGMFYFADSLTSLDLTGFDFSGLGDVVDGMFQNTASLISINATGLNFPTAPAGSTDVFLDTNPSLAVYCDQGGSPGTGSFFGISCSP